MSQVEWLRVLAFKSFAGVPYYLFSPQHLACRLIYGCLQSCLQAVTCYTTIVHVFTGLDFGGSVQRAFGVLRRNFVGAYVVNKAARDTISMGIWVFSMAMTMFAWYLFDEHFEFGFFAQTVDNAAGNGEGSVAWAYMLLAVVGMMYIQAQPVFGIIVIVVLIAPLAKTSDATTFGAGDCPATFCIATDDGFLLSIWFGFWISMFCGCLSNLVFTYIGHIIEDTINTVFMCYAIDQDNGAVRPGQLCIELQKMPQMASPVCVAVPGPGKPGEYEYGATGDDYAPLE